MVGSRILNQRMPKEVEFDCSNSEHLAAFSMLCLGEGETGDGTLKQHPTLRFVLEHPHDNIRAMMFHKIGVAFKETLAAT